ncbi:MAG: hypothetical protein HFH81_09520 [Lachnospiraceae bacterium]|jgi:hypothetical protein|nr:hypothetical protein [Lachnospiraceae bacterium]
MDDELGFTAKDLWIDGGHLNMFGERKIARAMGEYIQGHYGLEDHRGQEKYSSWEENADMLEKEYLRLIQDKEEYFAEVSAAEYTCLLIQNNSDCLLETSLADQGIAVIRNINGISDIMLLDWVDEGHVIDLGEAFEVCMSDGIAVYREGNVLINEIGNGAVAVIYDEQKKEVIDVVVMMENSDFAFRHRQVIQP